MKYKSSETKKITPKNFLIDKFSKNACLSQESKFSFKCSFGFFLIWQFIVILINASYSRLLSTISADLISYIIS